MIILIALFWPLMYYSFELWQTQVKLPTIILCPSIIDPIFIIYLKLFVDTDAHDEQDDENDQLIISRHLSDCIYQYPILHFIYLY